MSDSNRVGLYLSEDAETSFGAGVEPNSIGDIESHSLRYTGESLKGDTASTNSNEIRSDRNITSIIRTGLSASGDMNIEFSIPDSNGDTNNNAGFRLLMADALQSTATAWPGKGAQYTGCVSATADDSLTSSGIENDYPTGSIVYVASATTTSINGWYVVISTDTDKILVDRNIPDAVADCTVEGLSRGTDGSDDDFLVNSTTLRSRTLIKNYEDVSEGAGGIWSNVYGERYDGFVVDTLNLTIPTDGILTGSFGCLARRTDGISNVDYTTSTSPVYDWGNNVTDQSTAEVTNSIDHVAAVFVNNVQGSITGWTLQLQNNLRSRLQVGTLGAISMGAGYVQASGTLQAYFTATNASYLENSSDWDTVPIHLVITDADDHLFTVIVPQAKITSVTQVAGGVNQDVIVDMQWSGFYDTGLGGTIGLNSWQLT